MEKMRALLPSAIWTEYNSSSLLLEIFFSTRVAARLVIFSPSDDFFHSTRSFLARAISLLVFENTAYSRDPQSFVILFEAEIKFLFGIWKIKITGWRESPAFTLLALVAGIKQIRANFTRGKCVAFLFFLWISSRMTTLFNQTKHENSFKKFKPMTGTSFGYTRG